MIVSSAEHEPIVYLLSLLSKKPYRVLVFFFFNDTATTEIYTLSLHDALPICPCSRRRPVRPARPRAASRQARPGAGGIRRGSASRRPPLTRPAAGGA